MPPPPAAPRVPLFDRSVGAIADRWPRAMRWLGDIETRAVAGEISALRIERPVYICGLARAGSTLLLELLAAAPGFTTHRYSDYPMLWTPYWWNWLRARLPLPAPVPAERAHQDRLTVTPDSPEAFEEVFWMHFFKDRHDPAVNQILDDSYTNDAFDTFYEAHIRKLLAVRGARRYLAKGNYNLTRIGYLRRLFPDAKFVIAVREPIAHVASLVKQDRLFTAWAQTQPAISAHLARIGHFEFGPRKRAIHVGDASQTAAISACFAAGSIEEGYARQWAASYGWLVSRMAESQEFADACHLVGFERLCAAPAAELGGLYAQCGVDELVAAGLIGQHAARIAAPDYYSSNFSEEQSAKIKLLTGDVWRALVKKV
jgi:hypothetical protein